MLGTLALCLLAASARAETAAEALRRAPGARPAGLGGAFVAVADDAHAVAWNPAGLSLLRRDAAYASRFGFFGTSVESAGYGRPYGNGGLGARVDWVHGSRSAAKGGVAGSMRLFDGVHAGAGVYAARAAEGGRSANAALLDLGVLVGSMPGVMLGGSAQNLGTGGMLGPLPENIRVGTAVRFAYTDLDWLRGLVASLEINYARHRKLGSVALGAEYRWRQWAARLGASGGHPEQTEGRNVSLGLGWKTHGLGVDYAFTPAKRHGDSHRLGLTYGFGTLRERPAADYLLNLSSEELADDESAPLAVHLPERQLQRAEERLREGHPKLASRELEHVRKVLYPEDPRILRYYEVQGRVFLTLKEWAAARENYVEGIQAARDLSARGEVLAHLYAGLGRALAAEGRRADAIRFLQAALREGPAPERRRAIEELLLEQKYVK